MNMQRVLDRALDLSNRKEYQSTKLFRERTSFDDLIDKLDAPVRIITKQKFTKIENVSILLMTAGLIGGLIVFGLSRLGKQKQIQQ
jgi:hypothetical protein